MDAVVGVQSGNQFLDAQTLQKQFDLLPTSQQNFFRNLAGRSIPNTDGSTFLSGDVLPNNPVQVYGLTQWQPPSWSALFGSVVTPTQPKGYGFFQDLAVLNEYYPRYLQKTSPIADSAQQIMQASNAYNKNMFASYGNTYFNAIEKSQMQDKAAKMYQMIASAVIAVAAWGSSAFLGPVEGSTQAATSGATVSQTGSIDPTYFGFEGGNASLGISDFAFGPTQLSPQVTAGLTGASAFAGGGILDSIGNAGVNTVRSIGIAKPINEFVSYVSSVTGKFGDAFQQIMSGNFDQAVQVFTNTATPAGPMINPYGSFQGGGGGGSGLGVSESNAGQFNANSLIFPVMGIAAIVLVWLIVRKK